MNNDCGCTKKIVDKIYIENSCCKNKELSTCNNTSCTKCGKLIDLIDSDLYAENIYNYQGNTAFDSSKVILLEGEMLDSRTNLAYRNSIYDTLNSTDYKTELLIQLRLVNGLYGLNCVASLRKIDSKYIVIYIKLYTDDTIPDTIPGKTNNIKSILSIYTNDNIEATYETIDVTSFTCQEILSLLENYVTSEDLEELENNLKTYIQNNYYNKEDIDNLNFGEDCLFEVNEDGEDSTQRKGQGNATGKKSFAIQGGTASGENSIAIEEGTARGKNTLAGIKSDLHDNASFIDEDSRSCISLIGGNIQGSKDSIAISGGAVINANLSASLLGGRCISNNSISIGNGSASGKDENFTNFVKPNEVISNNISLNGGTACGKYSIALGGPKDTGSGFGCIACNRGSTAIGDSVYSGGKYSFVFGQDSEVGRFIDLNEDLPTYVGDEQSQESVSLGYLNTVTGKFSSAIGERNFVKLSESSSCIGHGNAISTGKGNFAFGDRNYIEGFHNVAGGLYSRTMPFIEKDELNNTKRTETFGSVAIGEPFAFLNLFLKPVNNNEDSNTPQYNLYYKNGNYYEKVSRNSKLGKIIEDSNIIRRNGTKLYLGTVNFDLYTSSNKVYPGINSYSLSNDYVIFTLTTKASECGANKNGDYYPCSIKFAGAANTVRGGKGAIAIGLGNTSYGNGTTSFGIKNESKNDGEFSCGKYNLSTQKTLFTIGNGYYEDNKINRMNVMEVTEDSIAFTLKSQEISEDTVGIGYRKYDVYDDIISKLNDIIDKLNPLLAQNERLLNVTGTSVSPVVEDTTSITSTSIIPSLPGYDSAGYVRTADLIVYDPNNVVPQTPYYDE